MTWINGALPGQDIVNSAENLCRQNLIGSLIDVSTIKAFHIEDACLSTVYALYQGNIPFSLPSDNFPTFFADISTIQPVYTQAIKAMCFLEYTDGRSCFPRDFNTIGPLTGISPGYILRMLYEAWNVSPDTTGHNVFDPSPSQFLNSVTKNDFNYGYFKRANTDGFLSKYIANGQLASGQINPGEFYIFLLNEINSKYPRPTITAASFYDPNNIQLNNSSVNTDLTRGVFKTYEQDGFILPSGGLGLSFNFSYHSDWLDIPTLGYSYTNVLNLPNSNYIDERAREHNFPLGLGWTHSYNIFAQSILDSNSNNKYIIIRWGDGSITVYNTVSGKFESAGVYDKLIVTGISGSHISAFNIVSKDQITTEFTSNVNTLNTPVFFQAIRIRDQNNNVVQLYYETASCASDVSNCSGTSTRRLYSVSDGRSGHSLNFHYQSGTDLLDSVTDNGNRSIRFDVNKYTLNLDAVTNANLNTTKYNYGSTDKDNHLLTTIQRPMGNTITNTYINRKLSKTQTPNYIANVTFTSSYATVTPTTQGIVSVTPNSGTQYSTTYNQNSTGLISTVTSASSNISYTYGDNGNPTLPTLVVDNNTGLRQSYSYDSRGNILSSALTGRSTSITNQYTYDAQNHVLTNTWPNSTVSNYTYDQNGNKTKEAVQGYSINYGINSDGTVGVQTDAIGVQTGFNYNQYGNLNSIALMVNPLIQSFAQYDSMSRLMSITDFNGNQTQFSFDPDDNLLGTVQDAAGLNIKTSYDYDKNDNVKKVTPPTGYVDILSYDANDVLIKEQQGGLSRQWSYNQDGTLNSYSDKIPVTFSYTYFPKNDPNEGKLESNGFQTYSYDNTTRALNQVTTSLPENGSIKYFYDDILRPNDIQFNAPTYQSEVSYVNDVSGNLTKLTLVNEGKSFNYQYDNLNRLQSIRDWNNNLIVQYTYLNNNLLNSAILSNGATTFYHYDGANRLDSIYTLKSDQKTKLYTVGCSMDGNGNHIRESSYVLWNGPVGTTYPQQGSTTFGYDQYSRLTDVAGQAVVSGNNGIIKTNPHSTLSNAGYDPHNHLIGCTVDGKNRQFLYDALENRYGSDSTRYTIDALNNGNVLAQKKLGQNAAQQIYVYSPNGLVCSIDPQTAVQTFYLYDFRGSTLATLDKTQSITNYYKYDPWGNVTEASTIPGKATPFLFVGQYGVMYESPHLYYMRARYYDPTIGRFLGEDPKWATNLFSYAGNNPVNSIDPGGLYSLDINSASQINGIFSNLGSTLKNTNQYFNIGSNGQLYYPTANGNIFQGNQSVSAISGAELGWNVSGYTETTASLIYLFQLKAAYKQDGNKIGYNVSLVSAKFLGGYAGGEFGVYAVTSLIALLGIETGPFDIIVTTAAATILSNKASDNTSRLIKH